MYTLLRSDITVKMLSIGSETEIGGGGTVNGGENLLS
jgi:hypothetical protein